MRTDGRGGLRGPLGDPFCAMFATAVTATPAYALGVGKKAARTGWSWPRRCVHRAVKNGTDAHPTRDRADRREDVTGRARATVSRRLTLGRLPLARVDRARGRFPAYRLR